MLRFRPLRAEEIPWERLDAFEDRLVFQTREWLNFIAETKKATPLVVEIRDGDTVAGYFSGLEVRKFGMRALGSSFPGWTTPYIGFNLLPGFSRSEAVQALRQWAFKERGYLHLEVSDWKFAQEKTAPGDLDVSVYESFASDLTKSEDELFGSMDSACRRCIRKSEKMGLTIEHAADIEFADEYYEQLKEVFSKQGRMPTYDVHRVRSLIKHLVPTGRLLLLRARNPEGRCIATGIYPGMNEVAYFWGNASWRSDLHFRPNEALHWYAMRYWKNRGVRVFDWGGGGGYKEKYGVVPLAVPWFYKSKYRFMMVARNEAIALFYRSQRLLGKLRGVPVTGQQAEAVTEANK
jgi:Acetyltransferase (GNAT) domain